MGHLLLINAGRKMLIDNLKVKSFIQAAPFDSRLINTFFLKIENELDEALYRINPLEFAEKHGLDEKKVVNIFILAARAGIFDLSFSLVCPTCGLVLIQDKSLNSLNKASFYCAVCHADVPVILDDDVEVVFHFNPNIYKVQLNPFRGFEDFSLFFFSRSFQKSGHLLNDFSVLYPGETRTFKLNAGTDMLYRLVAINLNLDFLIYTGNQSGHNDSIQLLVDEKGFSQKEVHLNRGDIKVDLKNDCGRKIGISLIKTDLKENKLQFKAFLNGKMLLNNTTFRNLFKIRDLAGTLRLHLRSLTLLFMELQGPADDAAAYDLIQKDFYILEEIADQYNGAVIKTMGNVIMVSFSNPIDGLLAAFLMLAEKKPELCLKIGLHEGHVLVINRDGQLDYFGRTVTIAARIQDLAGINEIFFSDAIYRNREIKKELVKQKDKIKLYKKHTRLKGVGKKITIYKMSVIHDSGQS